MTESSPFLSRIDIYPIKSLDRVEVQKTRVLQSGALEHDRAWALFDAKGEFVNAKGYPAIHRIRATIDLDEPAVTLRDESEKGLGNDTFRLAQDPAQMENWLESYFGFPIALRMNTDLGFPDDTASPGPTIISTATLGAVASWFDLPIDEVRRRFRANVEIDGVPAFWEEQLFAAQGSTVKFRIGDVIFDGVNPCQRCTVPPRNPWTGEEDKRFVQRFRQLRRETLPPWVVRERMTHFYRLSVNTRPHGDQSGKTLQIGDAVEILELLTVANGAAAAPLDA
jgi:MOSC domain-containing protein